MPRKRRKAKELRALTELEHRECVYHCWTGSGVRAFIPFANDEELRQFWNSVRADVLAEWIRERPGTRPWCWWRFEATERREPIDNLPHPFDCSDRRAHIDAYCDGDHAEHNGLSFGEPKYVFGIEPPRHYESEADYLLRLGLLAESEVHERGECCAEI